MVCDKVVCQRWCESQPSAISAMPATQSERRCHQVPRKVKVHVAKCHACHAKWQSMSPSATPAAQRAAASTASFGNPVRHQSRPSAVSATPATQSERRCHQVPRKVKVHVAKCHACHAKWQSMSPSATPATQRAAASTASFGNPVRHQSRPSAVSATPATQSERRCHQVPRLPRKVDKLCVCKL